MRTPLLALVLAAACAEPNEYVAPPPPAVTVAPPAQRDVIEYAEFTGTTEAYREIEIRARVRGFLAEILYKPGELVEKDTVLFRVDPAEYDAAVASAEADRTRAIAELAAAETRITAEEAQLALAETAVQKLERAYKAEAVSEILVLETRAKRDVARAAVKSARDQRDVAKASVGVAEARLTRAKLDLEWTEVKAPIRGRVAMWEVEVGGLVSVGFPTLLTTIISDEKVYCHFDASERWVLEIRKRMREKYGSAGRPSDIVVELALMTEEGYPHKGLGDYVEPTVDADTGTLRVRAIFDNADRILPVGAFARVRIPIGKRSGALLVTERAVGSDQAGDFVLVVDDKGVVGRRDVKLGPRDGTEVVVLEGIARDDRVIVAGLQRARPGATVKPEPAKNS